MMRSRPVRRLFGRLLSLRYAARLMCSVGDGTQILDFIPSKEPEAKGGVGGSACA